MISEANDIYEFLNTLGETMVMEMKEELLKNGSFASGQLYDSLTYELKQELNSYILSFDSEKYGKWVESGRKPGKYPPISKIKAWTKLKGIPEKAAFPIARKIFLFGIPPRPFIKPVVERNRDGIIRGLLGALKSETVDYINKELKYIMK